MGFSIRENGFSDLNSKFGSMGNNGAASNNYNVNSRNGNKDLMMA